MSDATTLPAVPAAIPAPMPGAALPAVAAPAPAAFAVGLDEFCTAHSRVHRGVELLAAFHHTESAAGRTRGLEGEFAARFAAFGARPVA